VAVCVSMLACSETSAGRIIAWDRLTVSRHNMGRLIFCLLWVVQRLSSVGGTRPTMSNLIGCVSAVIDVVCSRQ
jgi:hypothetical protein